MQGNHPSRTSQTDRDWERWGATSPYYGVLSVNQFRPENMGPEAEAAFFASGEFHMASVFSQIQAQLGGAEFIPRTALDFGCGVGRLAIPLSRRAKRVIAADVSESMLGESRRNAAKHDYTNLSFVRTDGLLSGIEHGLDLVHSYIVLQHIATNRGMRIISGLADRVANDGFLAIQFYTRGNASWWVRSLVRLRYVFPPAHWLRNLLKGRPFREQAMQLHPYDLAAILRQLRLSGYPEATLYLDSEGRDQFESIFLIARRTRSTPAIFNPYC